MKVNEADIICYMFMAGAYKPGDFIKLAKLKALGIEPTVYDIDKSLKITLRKEVRRDKQKCI